MKKLEIEIPNDKEIDWEESAKQKQIVFKDKQLTYEDVCDKLFDKGHYHTDGNGDIHFVSWINDCPNNASTKHQLECIIAKNKLANVARYLNGEWKSYEKSCAVSKYIIWYNINENRLNISKTHNYCEYTGNIIFKSQELAKQAIKILGEKTVKLALEPLY